jgi:hypothetical protein
MSEMFSRKSFWQWFRLLMGVLGLVVLVDLVDLHEISDALSEADWWYLAPAWLLMFVSTAFKTERWRLLLHRKKVNISFGRLFGTYLIGAFYSQFLPGSSAGGDAMRMAESSVDTGRTVDSVASVILERAIGMISILTTASLILLIDQPEGIPQSVMLFIYGLSAAGVLILVILRFGWFVGLMMTILERIKLGKVARIVGSLSQALQGDLGDPGLLATMVILSLLANAASMTSYYLTLLAVTDPVPYLGFISLVALIVTLEIIPLTPGSLGIREGAYVFFLGYLDVPKATALTISLLIRFLTWMLSLIGGVILLQRGVAANKQPQPAAEQ